MNVISRFTLSPVVRWMLMVVVVCLPLCVGAATWSADNLDMVHLHDRNRYVCDPDGVLKQALRDSADVYLRQLHKEYAVQTVFVVVRHVKDGDTFRMAQDLGNKYGVGTKKENRGLVVVVAVDDRRYTIAPGTGLEAELTDLECDEIARACIVKNMKVNQIDEMVVETARVLYNKLKTGKTGLASIDEGEDAADNDWIFALLVLLLCLGWPVWELVKLPLISLGIMKKPAKKKHRRHNDDDWIPPFLFGGGGGFGGGGSVGGSFGGGSFGGGGASGGW